MKFWTIWTLPAMSFPERLRRTRDWAAMTVAHHLPKRVKYWTAMEQIGLATMDSKDVMGATVDEILPKLDRPKVIA